MFLTFNAIDLPCFRKEDLGISHAWFWNISNFCIHGVCCAINSLIVHFQAPYSCFSLSLFSSLCPYLLSPFDSRSAVRDIVETTETLNYSSSRYLSSLGIVKHAVVKRSAKSSSFNSPSDLIGNMIFLLLKYVYGFHKMGFDVECRKYGVNCLSRCRENCVACCNIVFFFRRV